MSGDTARLTELAPKIVVLGVGGAGGNAINNMIASKLQGVHFVAANTDAQALSRNRAPHRIQLGGAITEGLGAGARPEIGAQAAEHSIDEIMAAVEGAHMLFITAGMGGGTGTGGAPVIARAAREAGVLTVAVVTKPFHFEGRGRMTSADRGIAALDEHVDTLITIPNQNLFRVASDKTTVTEAFLLADEVLHSGVRGITDLMTRPGLINLDFADVRTVMNEMGKAMMGTGEAGGERRAVEAAHAAVCNPLLDEVTLKGARAVLINITGSQDLTLYEVDEAANEIRSEVDPEATIIIGSACDESLEGRVRVSVVATGIEAEAVLDERQAARDRIKRRLLERDLVEANAGDAVGEPLSGEAAPRDDAVAAKDSGGRRSRTGALGLFGFGRRDGETRANAAKETPSAPAETTSNARRSGEKTTGDLVSEGRAAIARGAPVVGAGTGHKRESADRLSEEDLEIPAFLRRQA